MLGAFTKPLPDLGIRFEWRHILIHFSSGDLLGGKVLAFSGKFKFFGAVRPPELRPNVDLVKVAACRREDMLGTSAQNDFRGLRRPVNAEGDFADQQTPRAASPDTRLNVLSSNLIQTLGQPALYPISVLGDCCNRNPQPLCIIRIIGSIAV